MKGRLQHINNHHWQHLYEYWESIIFGSDVMFAFFLLWQKVRKVVIDKHLSVWNIHRCETFLLLFSITLLYSSMCTFMLITKITDILNDCSFYIHKKPRLRICRHVSCNVFELGAFYYSSVAGHQAQTFLVDTLLRSLLLGTDQWQLNRVHKYQHFLLKLQQNP